MLFMLAIASVLIGLVLWIVIVVDMFKKNVCWGLFGLFLFFPAYFHVVKYYSGKRKIVAPLFYVTTIVPMLQIVGVSQMGKQELAPFMSEVSKNLNTECRYTGNVAVSSGLTRYFVWCAPARLDEATYKNADEMVNIYKKKFIEPMLPYYTATIATPTTVAIKIGIRSPHNMVGCFELRGGVVSKS